MKRTCSLPEREREVQLSRAITTAAAAEVDDDEH